LRNRDDGRPAHPAAITAIDVAIITSQPALDWSGHALALLLGAKPRNMFTQLGESARLSWSGAGRMDMQSPQVKHRSIVQ